MKESTIVNQEQKKKVIIYSVIGALLLSFFWYQSIKNRLISLEESIESSWAQVENQLQRRFDLIPNLVNTVKGYTKHEKQVFTNIAEARSQLSGARTVSQRVQASNGLESSLSRLLMIVERYPDLKANQNFNRLMDELSGTENRLSVERRRFNENVKVYNQTIRKFPYRVIASREGFEKTHYFTVTEKAKSSPKVVF